MEGHGPRHFGSLQVPLYANYKYLKTKRVMYEQEPFGFIWTVTHMASSSSSSTASSSEELTLTVKWSGKEYTVRVCGDDSVAELKRRICELTNVLPKRQKLLYPKIGNKLADDNVLLSQLPLKSSLKMTMIGFVSKFVFFFLIWFKICSLVLCLIFLK